MIKTMAKSLPKQVSNYFSEIGRKGGKKSRRYLSPEYARKMVQVREAQRAFRKFYTSCFWSFDPKYKIHERDIHWVIDQLKRQGNRDAWDTATRLARMR